MSDNEDAFRQTLGATTVQGNRKRGTRILNNELYIGRQVWNRLNYRKMPGTNKRQSRRNDDSELIMCDVPHLRIVPQDLWEAAKTRQIELQMSSRQGDFWDRRRPRYLFSKLLVFGPVAVWCRSFDSIMCSKGDELWAQEEQMNSARMQCELR
jgi:hypothetical protein